MNAEQWHLTEKSLVALCLTFAAGFVDIVGFMSAFQIFTAHMTGVTVHLGQSLVLGDYSRVTIAAGVLISFILGSLVGRALIEVGARIKLRSIATVTLGIQTGLLIAAGTMRFNQPRIQAFTNPLTGFLSFSQYRWGCKQRRLPK